MTAPPGRVHIVGAGQAGYWAARTLRQEGFGGEITLLGDEPHPPYERPPLSKAVLLGEALPISTLLGSPESLRELNIDWRPNSPVAAVDVAGHFVNLRGGAPLGFDTLILCTGGRPRPFAVQGSDSVPIFYLRSLDDAAALEPMLQRESRLLIVGGGWIGLEIASSASKRGMQVTVVEAASRLCARALPAEAGAILERLHRDHRVDIRLECSIRSVSRTTKGVVARLSDGTEVSAAAIVAGIGIVPNDDLARSAGLVTDNGIVVDHRGRTSGQDIFAAGEVARYTSARYGRGMRLESWSHAQNHGIAVAKALLAETPTYDPVPWFWSDQFEVNVQMVGMADATDQVVIRGSPAERDGTIFYRNGERLTAAISFNRPRENRIAKKLIERDLCIDADELKNDSTDLQARVAR